MTKEDIIRLAIEHTISGLKFDEDGLLHFAKLVAEHEREACAEVCKKHADEYAKLEGNPAATPAWAACIDNHDFIRARGQA